MVGNDVGELGYLASMRMVVISNCRGHGAALNSQRFLEWAGCQNDNQEALTFWKSWISYPLEPKVTGMGSMNSQVYDKLVESLIDYHSLETLVASWLHWTPIGVSWGQRQFILADMGNYPPHEFTVLLVMPQTSPMSKDSRLWAIAFTLWWRSYDNGCFTMGLTDFTISCTFQKLPARENFI